MRAYAGIACMQVGGAAAERRTLSLSEDILEGYIAV